MIKCVPAFGVLLEGHLCIVPLSGARRSHWDGVYNGAGPLCLFGERKYLILLT